MANQNFTAETLASLDEIVGALREVQQAVSVAIAALRHQDVELDESVALTLERGAEDRLEQEIARLAVLLPAGSAWAMDGALAMMASATH